MNDRPDSSNRSDLWTIKDSEDLYGIDYWGSGYFRVNELGHVCVHPAKDDPRKIDLLDLTLDLKERGIRTPILVRFPNIVDSRIKLLNGCFTKSITDYGYKGAYRGVYPIKVNQQRHLVEEILNAGNKFDMGLECGSKPELLVALAMVENPEALIICNGFKDSEYIETALLAQKLNKKVLIVIDRFEELPLVIKVSRKLQIAPHIGFRVKLWAKGSGKWIESSGNRSKFGLSPSEIVEGVDLLKKMKMESCLELLHFHIGSQINSIKAIKSSLREASRVYCEIVSLGIPLKYIDVGGGLGVDYDGSGSSDSSVNYTEQEYANDVVHIIQQTCDEKQVHHPDIITESGRALVAHQSMLITNVLGCDEKRVSQFHGQVTENDHSTVHSLNEIYEGMDADNFNESFNDLQDLKDNVSQLFNFGVLSLKELAKAEDLIAACITKMESIASTCEDSEDILEQLQDQLSSTYFTNFSVFQSLPDSWAVGQVFPVMPIHRLEEAPDRQATLVDLTCDSDGKIEKFLDIETGETKKTLSVHSLQRNQEYFLGVFLVGAYQEILGDLHNLFGDTDAVHIKIHDNGYTVDHVVEGDTVGEILGYLEYNRTELSDRIRRMSETGILEGTLQRHEARLLMRHFEQGLSGYTYLEDLEG